MERTFTLEERGGILLVGVPQSSRLPGVEPWFTTRVGGLSRGEWASLNVAPEGGDDRRTVAANHRRVLEALDIPGVFLPRQVHGAAVLVPPGAPRGFMFGAEADAVVGGLAGVPVGVMTADCLPVLLAHRDVPGVAAVHAGWRGIAANVLAATVAAFLERFPVAVEGFRAHLGPSIGPCCYEVERDVAEQLVRAAGPDAVSLDAAGHWRADLPTAAARQLARLGLSRGAVTASGLCTHCSPELFFSHRRDAGRTGRMAAVILRRAEG